jgi:poly(hydroxyalkanoate) depolymerase family esterase
MRKPFRAALTLGAAALLATVALTIARPASAASLVEVTNFGNNPTNLRMHLYVPDRVVSPRPPILVAVHYCTGTGPAFYSGTQFASLADQYGFIVIYPSATRSGQCFDVSSPAALSHSGNSDPAGIVSMVRWVVANRNGDANRVYATGASSGAMMTNVLLATYPDVFKAGAAFAGVPHACFATTDGSSWNSQCANGQRIMTAQQWGDLVRSAYPGYTGARPRMQLWHGTADTTLQYPNFGEEIKQWTNVHGLSQTPSMTDTPQSGWTRTRYGGTGVQAPVEGISLQGVGHNVPLSGQAAMAIAFMGLNTSGPGPDPSSPSSPGSGSPSNPPPPGGCSASVSLNQWNGGYVATVTVTAGSSTINGWTVSIPSSANITNSWNTTRNGTNFSNVSYNGRVNAGQSTQFGFQGTGTGPANSGNTCTAS